MKLKSAHMASGLSRVADPAPIYLKLPKNWAGIKKNSSVIAVRKKEKKKVSVNS